LAAYKATSIADIAAVSDISLACNYADHPKAAKIVLHIYKEMGLHIDYCKDFGITKEEIEATTESQGMRNNLQLEKKLK